MRLKVLPYRLYLARADAPPASWEEAPFFALIKAPEGLTLVAEKKLLPQGARAEGPFVALAFEGPLPLAMIGVLGKVGSILAEVGVSIFAYSAFETDYILVREKYLNLAKEALTEAGYEIVE